MLDIKLNQSYLNTKVDNGLVLAGTHKELLMITILPTSLKEISKESLFTTEEIVVGLDYKNGKF